MNIRTIISYFYAGTGGIDAGLIYSAQRIKGGQCWERIYHRYCPPISDNIMDVVKEIISESLKEEINCTITEKLKGEFKKREIENLTHRYHKGIKKGNNDVGI